MATDRPCLFLFPGLCSKPGSINWNKTSNKPMPARQTKTERAIKQINQSIARANKIYQKAGAAQRRVLIAKDALQQLKVHKIKAMPGTYVNAYNLVEEAELETEVQLNTLLHNPMLKSSCKCCARGALLLSAVRYRNDCIVKPDGYTSEDSYVKEFSVTQQDMIEAAFEKYADDDAGVAASEWSEKFLSYEERHDSDKRLALILKNIIRNKGTFKPTER